jgi:hypothetical protein
MEIRKLLILAAHEKESRFVRHSAAPFTDYKLSREGVAALSPPGSVISSRFLRDAA